MEDAIPFENHLTDTIELLVAYPNFAEGKGNCPKYWDLRTSSIWLFLLNKTQTKLNHPKSLFLHRKHTLYTKKKKKKSVIKLKLRVYAFLVKEHF